MSTSLLYHAFGIWGYVYTRTEYKNGNVTFRIHQERRTYRCSSCSSIGCHPAHGAGRYVRRMPID